MLYVCRPLQLVSLPPLAQRLCSTSLVARAVHRRSFPGSSLPRLLTQQRAATAVTLHPPFRPSRHLHSPPGRKRSSWAALRSPQCPTLHPQAASPPSLHCKPSAAVQGNHHHRHAVSLPPPRHLVAPVLLLLLGNHPWMGRQDRTPLKPPLHPLKASPYPRLPVMQWMPQTALGGPGATATGGQAAGAAADATAAARNATGHPFGQTPAETHWMRVCLVQSSHRYRSTSRGTFLPPRPGLPAAPPQDCRDPPLTSAPQL